MIRFLVLFISSIYCMENYETFWEKALGKHLSYATFQSWLKNENAESRVAMRRHVKLKQYKSILDVPSGLCNDYFGFVKDGIDIKYQGVDITKKLVSLGKKKGVPIIEGDIKNLPFEDSSFDLCYGRHILEHLESYEKALEEMVRVGRKEVLVTFFIKPSYVEERNSYHYESVDVTVFINRYSKKDIELFLKSNPKIESTSWQNINDNECILHVYLNS